jgi:hypothetical protein
MRSTHHAGGLAPRLGTQLVLAAAALAAALLAGCSDSPSQPGVDAAVAPARTATTVLSGAGTMGGSRFTLDVQVGEALVPRTMRAGDITLVPHQPVTP